MRFSGVTNHGWHTESKYRESETNLPDCIICVYARDSGKLFPLRVHSCLFVVRPGPDLTIPSLRRSFSLSRQSMKRYLPFVIVAAVALVTLGSGAMLYRAKRPQVLSMPENRSLGGKSGTESMHIRGNPDAPATLEEFAAPGPRARSRSRASCGSRRAARPFLGNARRALSRTSGLEQGSQCSRIIRILRRYNRA